MPHLWPSPLPRCAPWQEHMFELGERANVLRQVDEAAVIPHVAEVEGKKFPYEVGHTRGRDHACSPARCRLQEQPEGAQPSARHVPSTDHVPGLSIPTRPWHRHPPPHPAPPWPGDLPERSQAARGHRVQRVPVLPRLLGGRAPVQGADRARGRCGGGGPDTAAAGAGAATGGEAAWRRFEWGQRTAVRCGVCVHGSNSCSPAHAAEGVSNNKLLIDAADRRARAVPTLSPLWPPPCGPAGAVGCGGRAADDPAQRGAPPPDGAPPHAVPRRLPRPRQPAAVAALQGGACRGGRALHLACCGATQCLP